MFSGVELSDDSSIDVKGISKGGYSNDDDDFEAYMFDERLEDDDGNWFGFEHSTLKPSWFEAEIWESGSVATINKRIKTFVMLFRTGTSDTFKVYVQDSSDTWNVVCD